MNATPASSPGITMTTGATGLSQGSSAITINSTGGFSGIVDLSATCCRDVVHNRTITYAGTGWMSWAFTTNGLSLPANGSAASTLNISIPNSSLGNTSQVGYGKYLMTVTARGQQQPSVTASTDVGILVTPTTEAAPLCKAGVPSLPLISVFNTEIMNVDAPQPKTKLVIAVYAPGGAPDTWRMEISDEPSIGAFASIVELENQVSADKQISTVGCSTVPLFATVKSGHVDHLDLFYPRDQVIVLRKLAGGTWQDVATFSETLFWSVFGGKRVRLVWLKD